jgi:carboxyl-terminal processing protease
VVGELHDFHAGLGTNDNSSPRLVPSGADILAHWEGNRAVVDDVLPGSVAAKAGVRPGSQILKVNQLDAREACQTWLGVRKPDKRAWDWALNSALAGRRDMPRLLVLSDGGKEIKVDLPTAAEVSRKGLLTAEMRDGGILYLRPQNSLGDNGLIAEFDRAVPKMRTARGIVIDLRDTPGGGNSSVARGIMGLFVGKRLPYQRHRVEEPGTNTVRDRVEYVTPRLARPIWAKLVVLVSGWTGSMGEGIAIGFDGLGRARVVGTPMAGLRGAVDGLDLPKSGIPVRFPTEQIFHINGTPRHLWRPPVRVVPDGGDPWWQAAKKILSSADRG